MNTCTPLDPRLLEALHYAREYWYAIVIGLLLLVIAALWSHGR